MCGCVFVGVIYAKVQFAMSQARDEMRSKEKSTLKNRPKLYLVMRIEILTLICWLVMYFCSPCDKLAVTCHPASEGAAASA